MIKSLLTEYGLLWVISRFLYSAKLKIMKAIPLTEKLFEKRVLIKRMDIFDINVATIEDFLNKLCDKRKEEIITVADRAAEGKIKAFSSIELDYGNPINWHYNPITKKEVDKSLKWYKIKDFDPIRGDIKVIWEASRLTHFFNFARAYMITKDKKYYKAFSTQLESWINNNCYSYGINYKCGQEAAIRMINAIMVYSVFKAYGLCDNTDEDNLCKLVEGSYKKILSNFFYAHKCIKNNHTLSEITGMIIGAWCSEDIVRLEKAYRLLDKEIKKQFLPDGGYIQNSFNYQRLALQLMEFNLSISRKTKMHISDNSKYLIKNSALLLYQLQDDSGYVPNRGANDGALIFPLTSSDYRDYRPVINSIHALTEGSRLYKPGAYDEEVLWFIKGNLTDIPIIKLERKSQAFRNAGLYSLRCQNSFLMVVLQDFNTRPGQMDQLHIDLWYNGKDLFCDSGSYSYASELGRQMSLTAAHNTVKVDDKDQMKKHGPFLVYDWTSVKDIKHDSRFFCGTMISKNGYSHMRSIKVNGSNYIIEDKVYGEGKTCECIFNTPCSVRIVDDGFELTDDGNIKATVKTAGSIEVNRVYRSLYYLKKEEINRITVSKLIEDRNCTFRFEIQLD